MSFRRVILLRLGTESDWRYLIPVKQKGSYKTADLALLLILYQLTGTVSNSYIAPYDIAPPSLSALESL